MFQKLSLLNNYIVTGTEVVLVNNGAFIRRISENFEGMEKLKRS